ncbi:DUF2635 domain-containing protein [Pandoraea nosoerga]|uniref:DUF2635 domain-containing protein n=2 Tax=Pandoraea TaxID=93217 RepID=A0A5E4TC05_9BURK|nr:MULTISPECIES: DUF2635 domain-containing protein [Pandoraea]MBN4664218.1 DUF2635 domain-containing protein [Pandoraea nosoerga]MBN4675373.1 DUF2635 domain-containing protein [Pandoraea nosoerga]MBN4679305.1 DUF2635 domain-containing protein [Pandoraea nosoerga]MBN4743697.1 DUF2635 domain-containing protein [Pandoraea nosoerga]VVD84058.1 hypothetical protein PNO31109_01255 [Pandoraea nosoerga]
MLVKARTGLRVPKERASREYITDTDAIEVPDTVYYRRRVAEGDLVIQGAEGAVVTPATADGKKSTKGA